MDLVLVAGLWMPASVWTDVITHLDSAGHRATAVTLPGQGDGVDGATLDDQLDAVLAAIDAADRPVVVGHSAAVTLAWFAADRRPDSVARVALVGGFPSSDGDTYAAFFPVVDGAMPFPGWAPFEGPDAADLDDATRARVAATAIPVPEGVSTGTVRYADERRFDVPVTVVCPEFTPDQAKEWIAAGDAPELAAAHDVTFVDIDSGHWPMITRPAELAALLA